MKRTLTELRTFRVKLYCECGGEFTFNGHANLSYPPQYVHVCGECGRTTTSREQYPATQEVEVGEEQEYVE